VKENKSDLPRQLPIDGGKKKRMEALTWCSSNERVVYNKIYNDEKATIPTTLL
jgi:hypothetical protein